MVGKVVFKKILGVLVGFIGWVIIGVLVSINFVGLVYRVIVLVCVLIVILCLKLKVK